MQKLFQWSKTQPFHISVGALLTNDQGEICAHHFLRDTEEARFTEGLGEAPEYYQLMRESIEDGESLEQTVARGLMEESGARGTLVSYLGSIQSHFPIDGILVEKTTLYFHVVCSHIDVALRQKDDGESGSTILWMKPQELYEKMRHLGSLMERNDRDESKIVKTYIDSLK